MQKVKGKRRGLQQPSSSFADYAEMSTDEYYLGKDFSTLMNAPLSKGGHFIFKSEKAWSIDLSQYSEFFTLDLETLSAAINCIPFNKYVGVDEKYFSNDQLTSINNDVEKGKAIYNSILDNRNMLSSLDTTCSENETRIDTDQLNKDKTDKSNQDKIDQLNKDKIDQSSKDKTDQSDKDKTDQSNNLNTILYGAEKHLNKPIKGCFLSPWGPIYNSIEPRQEFCTIPDNNDYKAKPKNVSTKPIDLEKWLDSILDD